MASATPSLLCAATTTSAAAWASGCASPAPNLPKTFTWNSSFGEKMRFGVGAVAWRVRSSQQIAFKYKKNYTGKRLTTKCQRNAHSHTLCHHLQHLNIIDSISTGNGRRCIDVQDGKKTLHTSASRLPREEKTSKISHKMMKWRSHDLSVCNRTGKVCLCWSFGGVNDAMRESWHGENNKTGSSDPAFINPRR